MDKGTYLQRELATSTRSVDVNKSHKRCKKVRKAFWYATLIVTLIAIIAFKVMHSYGQKGNPEAVMSIFGLLALMLYAGTIIASGLVLTGIITIICKTKYPKK